MFTERSIWPTNPRLIAFWGLAELFELAENRRIGASYVEHDCEQGTDAPASPAIL